MTKFTRSTLLAAILLVELPTTLVPGWTQTRGETAPDVTPDATAQGRSTMDRWEFTLDGRVGAPIGWLRVGEFPPSGATAGGAPGTRLRLSDAGIHVSEPSRGAWPSTSPLATPCAPAFSTLFCAPTARKIGPSSTMAKNF